jgi:hypothetical protein
MNTELPRRPDEALAAIWLARLAPWIVSVLCRWRIRRSTSSSLRLPAANPIFDGHVEKVCAILTMRSNSRQAICDYRNQGHGVDLEMEHCSGSIYFRNLTNIDQRLRNRASMLVPSPPASASTGD